MKNYITIILAFMFLISCNEVKIDYESLAGTYISNNKEELYMGGMPSIIDTLRLNSDGTFSSKFYGKGIFFIDDTFDDKKNVRLIYYYGRSPEIVDFNIEHNISSNFKLIISYDHNYFYKKTKNDIMCDDYISQQPDINRKFNIFKNLKYPYSLYYDQDSLISIGNEEKIVKFIIDEYKTRDLFEILEEDYDKNFESCDSIAFITSTNIYDNLSIDTIIILDFKEGNNLKYWKSVTYGEQYLYSAEITKSVKGFLKSLNLGFTKQYIIDYLELKTKPKFDIIRLRTSDGTQEIDFYFDGDKCNKVIFRTYMLQ